MNNVIQFLGLIMFLSTTGGLEAILPTVPARGHVPQHDALILFEPGSATPTNWTVDTLKDKNAKDWNYVRLSGETIRFTSSAPTLTKPDFLSRLCNDCCRMCRNVRDEFSRLENPVDAAGHVELKHGDTGWTMDNGRVDTVVDLTSSGALVIIGTLNTEVRMLTFNKPARVVIANIPIDYITKLNPAASPDPEHFKRYYDIVTFGFFCSAAPSTKEKCEPQTQNFPTRQKPPLLRIGSILTALDIDCSNSQYP